MEHLIQQAFMHVEIIGPHVQEGHYDLYGPDGIIILPQVWTQTVQPDWDISMHMWPMAVEKEEKKEEKPPAPPPPPPKPPAPPKPPTARPGLFNRSRSKRKARPVSMPPAPEVVDDPEPPGGVQIVKEVKPRGSSSRRSTQVAQVPAFLNWTAGGGVRRR